MAIGFAARLGLLVLISSVATWAVDGVVARQITSGLDKPIAVVPAPGIADRLFVAEQSSGQVRILTPSTGVVASTPFFTVPNLANGNSEQGLLGIAFHPNYLTNGYVYVNVTRTGAAAGDGSPSGAGRTDILRFTANGSPATATTAGNEALVLAYNQPESNHNGGWLDFGLDGMLYIAVGDGGSGNDPHGSVGNGQDRATLHGKILRIDVGTPPYTIPTGNPYRNNANGFRQEIWSWGLRNPWRCSFDRVTGDLWIGDVGQNNREEISVARAGIANLNFGWRVWEGNRRNFSSENLQGGATHTGPVVEYDRGAGQAVIGGYVYRGAAITALVGTYLYADYNSKRIWALANAAATPGAPEELTNLFQLGNIGNISSFGQDNDGELYFTVHAGTRGGSVYRLEPSGLSVSTASPLAGSTAGVSTSRTFTAVGGTPPYTWSVIGGNLPAGLNLSGQGVLSGTPTTAGFAAFTVQVSGGGSATKAVAMTIAAAPAITTSALPNAFQAVPYSTGVAASGGTGTMTWSLNTGTLPTGLSLNAGTGVISGTPSATGTVNLTLLVTDAVGATATRALSLTVGATPTPPTFTSTPRTLMRAGSTYDYDVDAVGSPAPTYSLTTAPGGMLINASTGRITWTTSTVGQASVTVRASNGTNATQSFIIQVHDHGLEVRPAAAPFLGMGDAGAAGAPTDLATTGLFSSLGAPLTPAAALIPFGVNLPFWSDHAQKSRFVSVPSGQTVTYDAVAGWTFPAGTVFVKHFDMDLDEGPGTTMRRLETRVLVRAAAGGVYGVTYRWNSAGTAATRVDNTQTENLSFTRAGGGTRSQSWLYPSPADCMTCHTANAGHILGANARQLNGTYPYALGSDNQLRTWGFIGLFSNAPNDAAIAACPKVVPPSDTSASLTLRARSYLDVNCAYCHQPGGAPANFDARFSTPLAAQFLINGRVNDPMGTNDARVIAQNDLVRSIIHRRVDTVAAQRMPPLGRNVIDTAGRDLLSTWIASLPVGDITGDGVVDANDIARAAGQMGRTTSDAGWDADSDVVRDGRVDAVDVRGVTSTVTP